MTFLDPKNDIELRWNDVDLSDYTEEQRAADCAHRYYLKGLEDGRREALAEVGYKKAVEMARNILKMGLSVEKVAESTGLTIEEVAQLQQQAK